MPTKAPLLWNEVAARHNKVVEEAQKDYEMAPDATEDPKVLRKYKKKLDDAKSGRYAKKSR